MEKITFQSLSEAYLTQLVKGAFLTVQSGREVNTMTIGWGSVGFMWNKPVLMVPVRYSRHTYKLIENAETFTVSAPIETDLKEALAFCGTKSGRDVDKIAACGLRLVKGQAVDTPVIDNCDLHIECRIVYKQAMEPGTLDGDIRMQKYAEGDFHVMYYGEIVTAYLK